MSPTRPAAQGTIGRPRVLYVIGSLGMGGAERQLGVLAGGMVRRGWECHVFALDADGPLRATLADQGVAVHGGGLHFAGSLAVKFLGLVRATVRLAVLLGTRRFLVVHGFLPLTNFLAAVFGRLRGGALVITSRRSLATYQDANRLWNWTDRVANALSHWVVANSQAVLEDSVRREGADRGKLVLIHNGLSLDVLLAALPDRARYRSKLGLGEGDLLVLNVANLIPYKGQSVLVKAFAALAARFPHLHLAIVGDDRGIGRALQAQAQAQGVADRVRLLGFRADAASWVAACDLAVVSSHEEGFCNFLIEAMALGRAVVATEVGGNAEALAGGEAGLLVPAGHAGALAASMQSLVEDAGLRARLGHAAAERARAEYREDAMVDRYLALYTQGGGPSRSTA